MSIAAAPSAAKAPSMIVKRLEFAGISIPDVVGAPIAPACIESRLCCSESRPDSLHHVRYTVLVQLQVG